MAARPAGPEGRWHPVRLSAFDGYPLEAEVEDAMPALDLPALDWSGYEPSAARKAGLLVIEAEAHAALGMPEGASDELRGFLRYGAMLAPERLAAAREAVGRIRENAAERIGDAVIIAPVAPCGPFPRSRKAPANQAELLAFANLVGLPALAFPCGRMANGMPFRAAGDRRPRQGGGARRGEPGVRGPGLGAGKRAAGPAPAMCHEMS